LDPFPLGSAKKDHGDPSPPSSSVLVRPDVLIFFSPPFNFLPTQSEENGLPLSFLKVFAQIPIRKRAAPPLLGEFFLFFFSPPGLAEFSPFSPLF